MDLEKIVAIGKEIGLTGQELQNFVKEREQRVAEERIAMQKLERDERNRQREHEKEMREYELKIIQEQNAKGDDGDGTNVTNSTVLGSSNPKAKMPKLPHFNEQKDDMDAYLRRFERFASAMGWAETEWPISLSALLTGKAMEVYSRLSVEQASDYKHVKESLLHRFQLTEEGFRLKFRNSKPDQGERYSQFVERLHSYLDRWMDLGNTKHTFEGLKDLFLREQLLNVCDKELGMFLKERKPEDVVKMCDMADRYVEAHCKYSSVVKRDVRGYQGRAIVSDRPGESKPNAKSTTPRADSDARRCYVCGKRGHMARECHNKYRGATQSPAKMSKGAALDAVNKGESKSSESEHKVAACIEAKPTACQNPFGCVGQKADNVKLACGHTLPVISAACMTPKSMPVLSGYMGKQKVDVLRDSGCSTVVARRCLVTEDQMLGFSENCVMLDGTVRRFPVAQIQVDTPYYVGSVRALCLNSPLYDLVLGNVAGVREPNDPDPAWAPTFEEVIELDSQGDNQPVAAVETRAQKSKKEQSFKPLAVPQSTGLTATKQEIEDAQRTDPTLSKLWDLAKVGEPKVTGAGNESRYVVENNLLFREYKPNNADLGPVKQLVVPQQFRNQVLKLAHDSAMAGHMRVKKTLDRVQAHFFWPGVNGDVHRYCISCDICQRTVTKGSVSKVPLGQMPLIDTPFRRVAVDIVGPIDPVTERGNRYILTLVDYATRYPEAVALPRIETERVAEALVEIFSRMGVPQEILTDRGTQFTSDLMREVGRLLSLKQMTTTPYHPMCNGLVEKFNGTLKKMLRKMCVERPRDWDRYLPALLFAYREVPQESLNFSPFELMFGRTVRGPLAILKELWTGVDSEEEIKTTYEYVVDLRDRLDSTCELARQELAKASKRHKRYYDARTRDRKFVIGDKVLVLRPTDKNKLKMQWKGPYEVVKKVAKHDYVIDVEGRSKTFHANLLKKYVIRQQDCQHNHAEIVHAAASLVRASTNIIETGDENLMELSFPSMQQTQSYRDVDICENRTEVEKSEIVQLLQDCANVLTDVPGHTTLIEHTVELTSTDPICCKAYPVPHSMQETIRSELDAMLNLGVIEKSESPYASPVVIVKKPDGSNRFCVDYRKLNKITVFDPEPIPNIEDIMSKVGKGKFFSKLDLTKGYWQIPISGKDKVKTAFTTAEGLYQFKVLPFGMVNAPAVFTRMMRRLLEGQTNVVHYIDDVLIFTETWSEHVKVLRQVLGRLLDAGLTAKPSKCKIGYESVDFLGHTVGKGLIKPQSEKVQRILSAKRPETKKQVRSFIGLANYYRKFIPNFAAIAAPITDLTKKGQPNQVQWTNAQENAFSTLKQRLATAPILRLPDPTKSYVLRTDASDVGLGAVLMQIEDDVKFPVCYASRKLLPREAAYAVIERECLALVWAIDKFHVYLYGTEFVLETDHNPLTCLTGSRINNPRLMRWALKLQPYRYLVRAIKGSNNIGADYLSRCPE